MSFDCLRKELENIDAFILVLDTKGINVWCAAAKGTFGTEELIIEWINNVDTHANGNFAVIKWSAEDITGDKLLEI